MNYQKIYDDLINKRKTILLENCYTEKHHIIPLCLGGPDIKTNIVSLTPEEHYLAHQLLVKIHPQNKGLKYAAYMMTIGPGGKRSNNKLYGWLKKDYLENRPKSKGHTGRKLSPEHVQKLKIARAKQPPMSDEVKLKISKTKTGVKMSDEAIKSMTKKRNEHPTWLASQRNKKLSDISKAKIGLANNGRVFPTKECPHCLKSGAGPNMTRYHFDNCKSKNSPPHTGKL